MKIKPKELLSQEEIENGLKQVIKDGFTSQIMVTLTQSAFLIAFALLLGASNLVIGIITAIPPLARLIQIPAVILVEKFPNRRLMSVISLSFYRICILLMAFIPIFFSTEFGLLILIILILLQSIFSSISATAYTSWIRDLIPREMLGKFYSKRMALSLFFSVIVGLLAGILIEYWQLYFPQGVLFGYSILYFLGFIFGIISIYFIAKTPEPIMFKTDEPFKFFKVFKEPFKDKNFRTILVFLALWSFALNLVSPFYTVYLIKRLELSILIVTILNVISQTTHLLFLRIWGHLSDNHSNKSVLSVCIPIYLVSLLLWPFTTLPGYYILSLPLLILIHILIGVSLAGIMISSTNITLKIAPKKNGNIYLTLATIITSIFLGIAPIIGGLFSDLVDILEISWKIEWSFSTDFFSFEALNLRGLDFFFIIALFIGLFSLIPLAKISEEGDIRRRVMFKQFGLEIRASMRNMAASLGVRRLMNSSIINLYYPEKSKKKNHKK